MIGPNGSGKSTLLKNICRVWEPLSGSIVINGKDYLEIPRKELSTLVTLVPQNTAIGFPISVFDIVSMGRNPHLGRFEGLRQRDREVIERALQQTNIYALKDRNINELSGGEGQLATIARAIATEAPMVLLDEPTSELDVKHTLDIINILYEFKEQGKTILVTIHDLNLARKFCDTISIMCRGKLFYSGTPEDAFAEGGAAYRRHHRQSSGRGYGGCQALRYHSSHEERLHQPHGQSPGARRCPACGCRAAGRNRCRRSARG